jgi:hypothetical protein
LEDEMVSDPAALSKRDNISQLKESLRPHLVDRSVPVGQRIRTYWAHVQAARGAGSSDVIANEFLELAWVTGLTKDLGWHGAEDIQHVTSWALRGMDPFGK